MKKLILFGIVLIIIFLWECGESGKKKNNNRNGENRMNESVDAKPNEAYIDKGRMVVDECKKVFGQKLTQAIAGKGVNYAIEYCSVHALSIADSLSDIYGCKIQRVSHKNRNPDNQANARELELIDHYQERTRTNKTLEPVTLTYDDEVIFYSPISIKNQMCLNCHGQVDKDIEAENYITLQMLYPNDDATGFAMGDLRGLWKLIFEKPES